MILFTVNEELSEARVQHHHPPPPPFLSPVVLTLWWSRPNLLFETLDASVRTTLGAKTKGGTQSQIYRGSMKGVLDKLYLAELKGGLR